MYFYIIFVFLQFVPNTVEVCIILGYLQYAASRKVNIRLIFRNTMLNIADLASIQPCCTVTCYQSSRHYVMYLSMLEFMFMTDFILTDFSGFTFDSAVLADFCCFG